MTAVGIVTLQDSSNIGNRLQNYALQDALVSLGCERVETIRSVFGTHNGYPPLWRAYHLMRGQGRAVVESVLKGMLVGSRAPREGDALEDFNRVMIHMSGGGFSDVRHPGIVASDYDYFVVGSDQVWNPIFGLPYGLDFLQFAGERQRISYAASFGVGAIPRRLRGRYREGLAGISRLSVRESQGQSIIRALTGREAVRVVDPTLLHDCSFWRAFSAGAPPVGDYMAVALLGSHSSRVASDALARARADGLDVIDIVNVDGLPGVRRTPQEFLRLIDGAARVLTDSFHASLFSFLFGRRIEIVQRVGMASRIATLLELVGLGDRTQDEESIKCFDPDWDLVQQRIAHARIDSHSFLESSLS